MNDRSEAAPAKASHDSQPPQALLDFMMQQWKPKASRCPPRIKNAEVFRARRRALSKQFPGETLVIPTGHEKKRANDTVYRFRPGSDFYYLTGNLEPDCALVLSPKEGGGHTDVLYVEPNPGHSDSTFFTDRNKGELWVGPRLGVEQSKERFGVDECRGLPALEGSLGDVRASGKPFRLLRNLSERLDPLLPDGGERDLQLASALSELRLQKDPLELRELATAIAATKRGFEDVIRALKTAKSEREIEGVFNLRARVEGNDVGYGTIAACGAHACILHWVHNDGAVKKGELLLLDAGIEGHSLYTADITRTLPVSGRFSPAQRDIYALVADAQAAAMDVIRPGVDFMDPHRAAMRVLAHGLELLGILPFPAEEALKEEHQFYKRYSLHNTSHMLGLDVHDCAQARAETYKQGQLKAGMVFTVEPGLYFQLDDLTVPARYRGIGVRIEDNVVVTAKGYKNLSSDIPRGPDEVEAWMAGVWRAKGPKKSRA
ncbi:MAG: aminopeptidase P family protein [Myxococcaceae bacterium]